MSASDMPIKVSDSTMSAVLNCSQNEALKVQAYFLVKYMNGLVFQIECNTTKIGGSQLREPPILIL